MNINQEFIDAVNAQDTLLVRIMLKDSLIIDPTLTEFDRLIAFAEEKVDDLYDTHDGEELLYDVTCWSKDYMNDQMVSVVSNFSEKRLELLKSIVKYVYREEIEKMQTESRRENCKKEAVSQKQIGMGLTVTGVATAAIGVAVSKPLVIGIGVAVAVAGGVLIVTDK